MVGSKIVEEEVAAGLDTEDGETEEQWQQTLIIVWRFDLDGSKLPTTALDIVGHLGSSMAWSVGEVRENGGVSAGGGRHKGDKK